MKHYLLPLLAVSAIALSGCTGKDAFQTADTDNDGRISPTEFDLIMLESIYAEADTDGDAKVMLTEYTAAYPSSSEANFKKLDADSDGAITPAEAKAFSDKNGTMTELFRKIDANSDGYLDREEIKTFYDRAQNTEGSTNLEKLSNASSE